jgi:hypothetical protein
MPSPETDSLISYDTEADIGSAVFPSSHAISPDPVDTHDGPPLLDDDSPSRISSNVGKSRLDGLRDSHVCPNGRVVHVLDVRSFRCGSGSRTNCRHNYFSAASAATK